jgi:hypothetical protein
MTTQQAEQLAARMGMSAWIGRAMVVGGTDEQSIEVKRVGFADIDLAMGEGETWDDAFDRATQMIFAV